MKRWAMVAISVVVLAVGFGSAAFAQTPTPPPANQGQPGWGCGGWGGPAAGGNYDPANNPTLQRLADKLGMSAADLAKELQSGKSVADVAGARKVDLKALVDLLQAPQADMLKIRVQYGYLTQDQADSMLKYMADQVKTQLEQKGFFGGGMMGGGMMGGYSGGVMGGNGGGMMGGYSGGMMGPRGGNSSPQGGSFGPRFRGSSF